MPILYFYISLLLNGFLLYGALYLQWSVSMILVGIFFEEVLTLVAFYCSDLITGTLKNKWTEAFRLFFFFFGHWVFLLMLLGFLASGGDASAGKHFGILFAGVLSPSFLAHFPEPEIFASYPPMIAGILLGILMKVIRPEGSRIEKYSGKQLFTFHMIVFFSLAYIFFYRDAFGFSIVVLVMKTFVEGVSVFLSVRVKAVKQQYIAK